MTMVTRSWCGVAVVALGALVASGSSADLAAAEPNGIVVYQSDFGLKDGAVSAMRGVALAVDPTLTLENLTHEIPPFDIWQGAYRLNTTAPYWPEGTVFVSVVDPGVGTDRKSVVLETTSGHYFVTPDNGTLTLIADSLGIEAVRQIDEAVNRLAQSGKSYTFHGRDVYSYTGARLAAGIITFEEVGAELPAEVVRLDYQAAVVEGDKVLGTIPILDVQYGNVWTNIDQATFDKLGLDKGADASVVIANDEGTVFEGTMPFVNTFGDVPQGEPLLYMNSVNNLAAAINWGDFAGTHGIESGPQWRIEIAPAN